MNNHHQRRNVESSTILPHDLLVEIFLLLPVRSLIRFKSVCKSWLSLISDPNFTKSHFDLAASPTYRYIGRINDSFEIEFLDINASCLHESSFVKHKIPFHDHPYFLGSCRGFVLVTFVECSKTFVWNPSTGVKRQIVQADHIGGGMSFNMLIGFGYDMLTDDYLIVRIHPTLHDSRNFVEYFSLRTNSRSVVEVSADAKYVYPSADFRVGSFLNQSLHWLVKPIDIECNVIIAFDLVKRSLSEIPLSRHLAKKFKHSHYHLKIMGDCLSLCYPGDCFTKAEIWMMLDYNVELSWTRLFVFCTNNIPRNVFIPICFTENGEIFGSNGSRRLLTRRLMKFNPINIIWLLRTRVELNKYQYVHEDCDIYIESLLSLPNDFVKASDCDPKEASEDDQLTSSLEKASEVTDNKN